MNPKHLALIVRYLTFPPLDVLRCRNRIVLPPRARLLNQD